MRVHLSGNGSGLGRAIQCELLHHGHTIVGTHDYAGRRLWTLPRDTEEFVGDSAEVLINNAGILDEEEFGQVTQAGCEKVFESNTIAPLLAAQRAIAVGARVVINIGSFYGVTGTYGRKPAYAASKAALHNLSRSIARICRGKVRCVAVACGIVPTGIHDSQGGMDKHKNGHSLLDRVGTKEELAKLVVFLVEDGTYINETILEMHGGR